MVVKEKKVPSAKCFVSLGDQNLSTIDTHRFAKQTQIIIPSSSSHLLHVNQEYLSCRLTCSLSRFLDPLIREYISSGMLTDMVLDISNKGLLTAINCGRIDHEDVFAVEGGVLFMSLTKETYQRSGLVGKPSKIRDLLRYNISFDLKDPKFSNGHKLYDRLLWSLTNVLQHPQRFVFSIAEGDKALIDVSNDLKAFFKPSNLETQLISFKPDYRRGVNIPSLLPPSSDKESLQDWASDLHEWLLLVSMGSTQVNSEGNVDGILSTYEPPSIGNPNDLDVYTWNSGLIPKQMTLNIWQSVLKALPPDEWAALVVHGVEDAPVTWKGSEHTFLVGGENHYTMIRLPDKQFLSFRIVEGKDLHT